MAVIKNIKLSAKKATGQGNNWDLTVVYDANFKQFELDNFHFSDDFEIWEQDGGSNPDDKITNLGGGSDFNPTVSPTSRTMKRTVSGAKLDTEQGPGDVHPGEELYAIVKLTNTDIDVSYTGRSPILHLNP